VTIKIPANMEPGGLYGSVLASAYPPQETQEREAGKAVGGAHIITRLGTLFFVRIKGDVKTSGFLKSFTTKLKKTFFESGPITFDLLFENDGNVHLTPYGIIEIQNAFGNKTGEIQVDPWFAMPDSVRLREVSWDKDFLVGRYTAYAKINRGYKDIIDEASYSFWVIPWKIILIVFVGLFLIIYFIRWIVSNFEIRRKSSI